MIPAKYFTEPIRGMMFRGASITQLITYTFLIITLAVMRFKKTTA